MVCAAGLSWNSSGHSQVGTLAKEERKEVTFTGIPNYLEFSLKTLSVYIPGTGPDNERRKR